MRNGLVSRIAVFVVRVAAVCCAVAGFGVHVARAANVELPVPRITIYPGDIISADAVDNRLFGPAAERLPVYRSRDVLVGKVARRTLIPGKPIPINAVRDAEVIQQGKQVKLVFQAGTLTITGVGVALQSGGVGDLLTVRNVDSGATVRGTVQADGTLKLEGP